jgi:flagellar hook-basal body complex protein FliE
MTTKNKTDERRFVISDEILKKHGLTGIHPVAEMFPLIVGPDRNEVRDSIRKRGVELAISVNPEGLLLDGRNRLLLADELGVECPQVVVDVEDEVDWIIARNLHRRHLNVSQRAMIAERLATMKDGGDRRSNQFANLQTETLEDVAKKMQVSPRVVSTARKVRKEAAPEVVAQVERGEMSLNAAHETLKQPEQPEQETKPPSAEIDAKVNKIVRLIQELFATLDVAYLSVTAQTLQNEVERLASKAQKKKQARASKLSQQKLNLLLYDEQRGRPCEEK